MLVSEHLGSPRQAQQTSYDYDADEGENGGYQTHDARRAWSTPPSRPPRRLWDTYTD